MNHLKDFWNNFSFYIRRPEMRSFWFLLLVIVGASVVQFLYLPVLLAYIFLGVFLVLVGVVFTGDYKLAKNNFAVNLEKRQLEGMIVSLQDGVIAYNPNFRVQVFNVAAQRLFTIKESEIINTEFTPGRAHEERFKLLAQVMFPSLAPVVMSRSAAGAWPQVVDLSFSDPGLELRVTTAKIMDSQGRLLGFMKIVRDRTREIAAARSKSEFVTVAAHQLRTPLNAIAWTFETLAGEKAIEDSLKQIIVNGKMATTKLLKTVNDLLDTAKIEEGRFGYQMQNIDFITFIEQVLAQKMIVARQYGIKLYFDRPEEKSLVIKMDPQRMTMAVDNFLDNAIKYNVKNGEVTVAVKRVPSKPFIQVSVADTGIGVPPEQVNRLFTKFFRGENVLKFQTEGTGLGIYISKNIIRQHGGIVWAESTLNRGSTFYFTLPTDSNLVPDREVFVE